jgi:hypothetical protein
VLDEDGIAYLNVVYNFKIHSIVGAGIGRGEGLGGT